MRIRSWQGLFFLLMLTTLAPPVFGEKPNESAEGLAQGQIIYERACQWCHGVEGNGAGPAAFFLGAYSASRPRDFTVGNYKFRSTPAGEMPTNQDLFRTITNGIPGTMPPFASLTEEERWYVVAYLKTFSPDFFDEVPETISISGHPLLASAESIEKGREVFFSFDCQSCHGANARGEGKIAMEGKLKDSTDLPILPTDLTNRFAFKNGASPRDIVQILMTGMVGTPMPSYASEFEGREDDAWHLANYIRSLSQSPIFSDPS